MLVLLLPPASVAILSERKVADISSVDTSRVVIGLQSSDAKATVIKIIKNRKGTIIKEIPQINALVFKIPKKAFNELNSDPDLRKHIKYIEKDRIIKIPEHGSEIFNVEGTERDMGVELTPNDPLFFNQWALPMIDAPNAWGVKTGGSSIIVAIVDTGVDYTHGDLDANVNASLGWDFVNNDPDAMDDNGHGTHVAGIVAAEMNNSIGGVGVAPDVTVMPVKVLNSMGSGWASNIAAGIVWAVDHDAKIVSLSLGSWFPSEVIKDATHYAVYDKGALCIAAAGNDGLPIRTYPAAYEWVIGVAALDSNSNRAYYSNYGDFVYLAAPGGDGCGGCPGDIVSTWPKNQYKFIAGTSMATPHVSGVAALYWAYNPAFTNKQVALLLLLTADDLGSPGRDKYYGFGRVDAWPGD